MAEVRLQKVMAAAGLGSRRACEELIVAGAVQVNGRIVTELGTRVDPDADRITVEGKPLALPERHIYVKVHKPRGVISDIGGEPTDRQTVADLLPPELGRVFPVGRLDLHSEGLVLLTDDGELAHRLTHPRYEHPKTYFALVDKLPDTAALERLRNGVDLPEGRSAPAKVKVADGLPPALNLSKGPTQGVWLEVTLHEGKKRQIRHMVAAVGYQVLRLVRWAIGPLTLGSLALGQYALLKQSEIAALRKLAGLSAPPPAKDDEKEERDERLRRSGPPRRAGASRTGGAPRSSGGRPRAGAAARSGGARPAGAGRRYSSDRPRDDRPRDDGPRDDRPAGKGRRYSSDRPRDERPSGAGGGSTRRRYTPVQGRDDRPRDDRPRDDRPRDDRPRDDRPRDDRPAGAGKKPYAGKPAAGGKAGSGKPYGGGKSATGGKPYGGKPGGGKPSGGKPSAGRKPYSGGKPYSGKPSGGRPRKSQG